MKTIKRTAEAKIADLSSQFPVVMVTGARQVGKTTLLKMLDAKRNFVTLDDPRLRELAVRDPLLFLQSCKTPLTIDEFQYAKELLPYIKMSVDANPNESGLYWLTGSQQFQLMKDVGESLAGRVAVLPLGGITQGEERGETTHDPFSFLSGGQSSLVDFDGVREVFARIHRGNFPALVAGRVRDWQTFYRSYVATYVERDVREICNVSDTLSFVQFLKALAARTGNLLNLSDVARDVGITPPTAKAWLSILEESGLVYLLRPYKANVNSRIVKTPKVYFLDTGLCCYLTGWTSPATAMDGAMSGALLETFVVSEIVRSFWNAGQEPPLLFYRDKNGVEIDLLLERDGVFFPVEIKKSASPSIGDVKSFSSVRAHGVNLGRGGVLCLSPRAYPLSGDVQVIPIGSL